MAAIQLLIGLGNPGPAYVATRHNVGQWLVELLAEQEKLSFKLEPKLQAQITRFQSADIECRLCLPTPYMNDCGRAVQKLSHYFKVPSEAILVVHDELDLPVGVARYKMGGGHGGHNGLRSIIDHIGNTFGRLRIGIGHPGNKDDVSDYVLHVPSVSDKKNIETAIHDTLPSLKKALAGHMAAAMNELHTHLQR